MYIVSCDGLEIEKETSRTNKDESFGVERLVSTFYLVLFYSVIGLAFNSLVTATSLPLPNYLSLFLFPSHDKLILTVTAWLQSRLPWFGVILATALRLVLFKVACNYMALAYVARKIWFICQVGAGESVREQARKRDTVQQIKKERRVATKCPPYYV